MKNTKTISPIQDVFVSWLARESNYMHSRTAQIMTDGRFIMLHGQIAVSVERWMFDDYEQFGGHIEYSLNRVDSMTDAECDELEKLLSYAGFTVVGNSGDSVPYRNKHELTHDLNKQIYKPKKHK